MWTALFQPAAMAARRVRTASAASLSFWIREIRPNMHSDQRHSTAKLACRVVQLDGLVRPELDAFARRLGRLGYAARATQALGQAPVRQAQCWCGTPLISGRTRIRCDHDLTAARKGTRASRCRLQFIQGLSQSRVALGQSDLCNPGSLGCASPIPHAIDRSIEFSDRAMAVTRFRE